VKTKREGGQSEKVDRIIWYVKTLKSFTIRAKTVGTLKLGLDKSGTSDIIKIGGHKYETPMAERSSGL
jgi:hypothetical protein